MTTDLGLLLRQWRRTRPLGMEAAAQQAGVTRMTLHRWETGQCLPRLPELEALLRVLEVTPSQRRQALALLNAPRALVLLDGETARETRNHKVSATVAGGLLHALRLRRGLTLDDTARELGIHKSTLSRWERGEAWPPTERLHRLCHLLEASVEELVALASGPEGSGSEAPSTVETLSTELQRVMMLAPHDPEAALKDLLFLRLEARVWPLSSQAEYARLLSNIRAAYASYLSGKLSMRYRESSRWADRALEYARPKKDDVWWVYAMQAQARCAVFGKKRPTPQRGMKVLHACLPQVNRPDLAAWVIESIAEYALLDGDKDTALRLSTQSCQVVQASEKSSEVLVRQCDHAKLLLSAGLPQQALEAVPQKIISSILRSGETSRPVDLYPNQQVAMALLCVQALRDLQDNQAAQGWLQRAYGLLETGYFNPRLHTKLRSQADRLAQLF